MALSPARRSSCFPVRNEDGRGAAEDEVPNGFRATEHMGKAGFIWPWYGHDMVCEIQNDQYMEGSRGYDSHTLAQTFVWDLFVW